MGGVLVRGEGGTGRIRWGRECIERRQGVCRGRAHGRRARGTPSGAGRGLPGLGPWLGQGTKSGAIRLTSTRLVTATRRCVM